MSFCTVTPAYYHPRNWDGRAGTTTATALAFNVTLNKTESIDKDKILGQYSYSHPVFSQKMVDAQQKRKVIDGVDRVHYCGAYWYNGFHEDGVHSAQDVCERIFRR